VVLGLSQDGACTDLSENFSEDSLKGDLSNVNIVSPPLFSLVNTFKLVFYGAWRYMDSPSEFGLGRILYFLFILETGVWA
jgi:hypothetical protein